MHAFFRSPKLAFSDHSQAGKKYYPALSCTANKVMPIILFAVHIDNCKMVMNLIVA